MTGAGGDDVVETEDERAFFRVEPADSDIVLRPASAPAVREGRVATPRPAPALRRFPPAVRAALARAWQRELGLGTPFLFIPVAVIAGVAIYFALPAEPRPWNIPSGLVALAALLLLMRNRPGLPRVATQAVFLVVGGMGMAQLQTVYAPTPMLGSDVTTRLTGRILAIEERASGRTRYTIEVEKTERPVLRYAPRIVRATAAGPPGAFGVGQGMRGVVRLTAHSGPAQPGGYDFGFHAYFDGVGANGFFLGAPASANIEPVGGVHDRIALLIERMRGAIGREIRASAPGRAGAVSAALVTGDKAGIPDEVTEALRVSGLAHILSISGLHMALVAATVMAALRLAFALTPEWSSRRPVKKYAAGGALVATGFYLFLAGAAVATQRSFAMLAIMLLALTFDRAAVTMRNLALAALVVVAIAPDAVLGPGFQMSFAATAALIAVYGVWQDRARDDTRRRPAPAERGRLAAAVHLVGRYALGIVVTSLVAGVATGIFASYHFGRVAPYGLLANLLALPVVSLMVMPLAVLAMVLMPFGLHGPVFALMARGVELVILVAQWVASLSPPVHTGQMPGLALTLFSSGLVMFCLLSTRLRWVALPLFGAAMLVWRIEPLPLGVVSEDGRQFALVDADRGALNVNRSRPNAFILEQWSAAYAVDDIVKPDRSSRMACEQDVCTARIGSGETERRIAYVARPVDNAASAAVACQRADLVIFAKAPSPDKCENGKPVISARMLALRGSAEIREENGRLVPVYALPDTLRPWADHRRYSRAARNLADWKPRGDNDQ